MSLIEIWRTGGLGDGIRFDLGGILADRKICFHIPIVVFILGIVLISGKYFRAKLSQWERQKRKRNRNFRKFQSPWLGVINQTKFNLMIKITGKHHILGHKTPFLFSYYIELDQRNSGYLLYLPSQFLEVPG